MSPGNHAGWRNAVVIIIFLVLAAPAAAQERRDDGPLCCCGLTSVFLVLGVLIVGTAILRNSSPARGTASMMNVRDLVGQPLKWILTPGNVDTARTFELFAGDDVVATLQEEGGRLSLEPLDETWSFEWTGFLSKQITVRVDGTAIAVYADGTLMMADGTGYRWGCTSFWRSQMSFCNAAGEPLVTYASDHATVQFRPAGASVPESALLTLLGLYILYKGMRLGDTSGVDI